MIRLALLLIIFLLGTFSTPTFASMGSTGGGHSSGGHMGGGGSIGGSFHSSSSTDSGSDSGNGFDVFGPMIPYHAHHIIVSNLILNIIIGLVIAIIYYIVLRRTTNLSRKWTIIISLISGFGIPEIALFLLFILPDMINSVNSITPVQSQHDLLLQQNQSPSDFERHLKLEMHMGAPKENSDIMQDNYAKAQYLYGNLIRQYVAGNHNLSSLKEYLAGPFYRNMVKEIKLKASQQTIDDVIVNKTVINRWAKCDDLTLIQITAYGNDSENQANSNFDSSFSRKTWTDYVVFDQDLKIVNLIYGEHFHLNGQDFNNDPGLSKGKYEEHDLRDHEHDMFN